MLRVALWAFLLQWNHHNTLSAAPLSARDGMCFGLSSSASKTTSFRATVIPAPVTGWRMLAASLNISSPGVEFRVDGSHALGMLRKRPSWMAFCKLGRTEDGTIGTMESRMYALTALLVPKRRCVVSGMSMRILVWRALIWYINIGGAAPRTPYA